MFCRCEHISDNIQRRSNGRSQKQILPILIMENTNTQPLLGLDWLDKLEVGLQGSKITNIIWKINIDERREIILTEFEDLFK